LELNLKKRLIPYEFVTQWNLTYDMMCFTLTYWKAVDQITADKVLKLRRYEIDNDDWVIVKDLVHVLEVISLVVHCACCATYITDTFFTYRNIKSHPVLLSRFSSHGSNEAHTRRSIIII
jgi:hypothetical protein